MPRRCTVCGHASREAIDAALLSGSALRDVARQWRVSKDALHRHKSEHIPSNMIRAREAREVASADRLLADLGALMADAARLAQKAEDADSYPAAIAAIREQARIIELLLRVAGELASGTTVNIRADAAWLDLRTQILTALSPYPEARAALAEALGAC